MASASLGGQPKQQPLGQSGVCNSKRKRAALLLQTFKANQWAARSKPVLWRPVGSTSWTTSPSATVIAQQLGMCKETVSEACRTESAAKGYEFRYQNLSELVFPGEEWRPVVVDPLGGKVPGRMVSSLGRITSQAGLISRGHLTQQGYYATRVQGHFSFVHRLVAFAFLGPPPSNHRTFVNHKDLDKGNNAADNLEWACAAQNRSHFFATSTLGRGTTAMAIWSRPHGTDDEWTWHHS